VARLIYSSIASLDGFIADASGSFEWAAPDEEVHTFVNNLERPIGTYLYGRRLYEVMRFWETAPTAGEPSCFVDYAAIWKAADKIVYSSTLDAVTTDKTTLETTFDPAVVREMKASHARDISVGGANLAAQALAAGLVDEVQLFVTPVIVGGGTAWLSDDIRLDLDLIDERRFDAGVVFLHYRVNQPR